MIIVLYEIKVWNKMNKSINQNIINYNFIQKSQIDFEKKIEKNLLIYDNKNYYLYLYCF